MSARDRYRARTAGVGTNVSGITGPIRDVKAEAESFERNIAPQVKQQVVDTFNRQRDTNQRDTYISPQEIYAPRTTVTTADGVDKTVPTSNMIGIDAETVDDLGFFDERLDDPDNQFFLSDDTLRFYGVDPGSFFMGSGGIQIPQELYQMLIEGSLVGQMEADNPALVGVRDKDGNLVATTESGTGTYSDLEAGQHPLLSGLKEYYDIMSGKAFAPSTTGGGGGSITPSGGGSSYGAGIASGLLNQRPKQLGDAEDILAQKRLLDYMVNVHRANPYTKLALRKKDGGLATIVGD
jgi:hypothetical protein